LSRWQVADTQDHAAARLGQKSLFWELGAPAGIGYTESKSDIREVPAMPALNLRSHVAAACCLLALALPAQASLQDNLAHTPAQADGLISISTDYADWSYFLERQPFASMLASFQAEIAPDIEQELGIQLKQELLPMLGTHMTIAVFQQEMQREELLPALIALDLKQTEGFGKLVARLKQTVAEDPSKKLIEKTHQGVTLYGFAGRRTAGVPYMALSGSTLLIGSQNLIQQAIDSKRNPQRALPSQQAFQVAHASLKDELVWVYANPDKITSYLALAPADNPETAKELAAAEKEMRKTLGLYDSLGFSLDLSRNGLVLKSFLRFKDKGLPASQQAYVQDTLKVWNAAQMPLKQLLQASPRRPLLFASLDGLHLLERGLKLLGPVDAKEQAALKQMNTFFKGFTNLDFQLDLLKHSDGRGGMVAYYPEDTQIFDRLPHMVLMLGVKDNAAFLKNLTQKLKLDLGAFAADKRSAKAASEQILFPTQPTQTYQGRPLYIAKPGPTLEGLKQALFIEPAFSYVDKTWLFASSPESLKQAIDLLQGRAQNLAHNPYFDRLKTLHGIEERSGMMFMDLHQLTKMMSFMAGEDEEIQAVQPTLSAFHSIMAGGKFKGRTAEGIFVLDMNMDRVDFELIGKLLQGDSAEIDTSPGSLDFTLN